jgi:hypothetical protein
VLSVKERLRLFEANGPATKADRLSPLSSSPNASRSPSPLASPASIPPALPPRLPERKPSMPVPVAPIKPALPTRKQATVPLLSKASLPVLPPRPISSAPSTPRLASLSLESKARPVDPRARKRYEALFDAQVALMAREDVPGSVVAHLWKRSKLPFSRLKEIWSVGFLLGLQYSRSSGKPATRAKPAP